MEQEKIDIDLTQIEIPGIGKLSAEQLSMLSEYMQFLTDNGPANQTTKEFGLELLECAKRDLTASKLLFSTDKPNSIYHLEQSVEKTAKAYGLAMNIVKINELGGKKGISHVAPRIFVRLLKKKISVSFTQLMKSFALESNIDPDVKTFEKLIENKPAKIAKMSGDEIKQLLELNKKIGIKLDEKKQEAIKKVLEFLSQLPRKYTKQYNNQKISQKVEQTLSNISSFLCIFILSVITYPHFAYTRYPGGKIEPKDYTETNGIVKMHNEICDALEKSMKDLEIFLQD